MATWIYLFQFKATALHRASLMGKSSAVKVLLKVGANVNQQDGVGEKHILFKGKKSKKIKPKPQYSFENTKNPRTISL